MMDIQRKFVTPGSGGPLDRMVKSLCSLQQHCPIKYNRCEYSLIQGGERLTSHSNDCDRERSDCRLTVIGRGYTHCPRSSHCFSSTSQKSLSAGLAIPPPISSAHLSTNVFCSSCEVAKPPCWYCCTHSSTWGENTVTVTCHMLLSQLEWLSQSPVTCYSHSHLAQSDHRTVTFICNRANADTVLLWRFHQRGLTANVTQLRRSMQITNTSFLNHSDYTWLAQNGLHSIKLQNISGSTVCRVQWWQSANHIAAVSDLRSTTRQVNIGDALANNTLTVFWVRLPNCKTNSKHYASLKTIRRPLWVWPVLVSCPLKGVKSWPRVSLFALAHPPQLCSLSLSDNQSLVCQWV